MMSNITNEPELIYKHYPSTPFMYFKQLREIHKPKYPKISLPKFSYPGFKNRNSAQEVMTQQSIAVNTVWLISVSASHLCHCLYRIKLQSYFKCFSGKRMHRGNVSYANYSVDMFVNKLTVFYDLRFNVLRVIGLIPVSILHLMLFGENSLN